MSKSKSNFIQSVDRALQILECFSKEENELGVTQIANMLDFYKSTTFGLLSTLENRGYLKQNPESGKYRLGIKLFELGKLVEENMDLRTSAIPYLKGLVDKYGETAHLAMKDGNEVIYIDKVEGKNAIGIINSQVGRVARMHCTGVGKAVLAFMSEEDIEKIIENIKFNRYTSNTITDKNKLKEELKKIRKKKYSVDNEEIEIGLKCVAAPIINYDDEAVGSISVSGPTSRMNDEKMNLIAEDVKKVSIEISRVLGYKSL
ncbi:IclR family transcriptional regulator [Clostridium autoethanogenum]|uniref:IclR family transcriptional regulator n=1 Tax=Clostridium autoethanogenum DSM 10061 TaxID=1341692 RepID=A0ABM5NW09_9CLOT|nr:IclR family transcriptional regulator [Clostridium autoethanogenum]AGY76607.1 IclR family transcriptional regulator [Clostridium autoethanogenum DSM 10061]ALU36763.1 Transcriptional regulator IclR family [Clostridium autoethanogenum DSM 10061]OVY50547.1 Acetate operon repressor [Clostridium autoethanogenum]